MLERKRHWLSIRPQLDLESSALVLHHSLPMGHIVLLLLPEIPASVVAQRYSAIHHLALLPLEERV